MDDFVSKPVLWGLDPLFHVHVKLFARMLLNMIPGQGTGLEDPPVFFYRFNRQSQPRPVRLVTIAGVVVQRQDYRKVRTHLWTQSVSLKTVPCIRRSDPFPFLVVLLGDCGMRSL